MWQIPSKTRPKKFPCYIFPIFCSYLVIFWTFVVKGCWIQQLYTKFCLFFLIFQKIIKNTNCRDPKFLFLVIVRGKLSLQLVIIKIIFWRWRTEFRRREMATNAIILTFDLRNLSAPRRSYLFSTWVWLRAFSSFI